MKDVATELAKKVPVDEIYEDLAKPGTTQAGLLVRDTIKTARLFLAPLQFGAAAQDRLESFIDKSIRKVDQKHLTSPPPQILGPVLEGVRYEPDDTPLHEMFENLLANSMDQNKLSLAHPAYPNLVKQLSSDEATVLKLLSEGEFSKTVYEPTHTPMTGFRVVLEPNDSFPKEKLSLPDRLEFYMEHLRVLGLAEFAKVEKPKSPFDTAFPASPAFYTVGQRYRYQLTVVGKDFVRACSRSES